MRTCRVLFAALVAPVLLAARAGAQSEPTAELDWTGVEQAGCLPEPLARAEVRARLERDPFEAMEAGASLRVIARAHRDADTIAILFRMEDGGGRVLGERELRSETSDCRSLDRSLVLALVLMIESPAARARIHLEPSPRDRIEAPALAPLPARDLRMRVETALDALAGWLASGIVGASVAISLESRPGASVHVRVHGLSSLPLEEARVDVLALRFEVGACLLASVSSDFALGGCAHAGTTLVEARGHGLGEPRAPQLAVPDVIASARAELVLGAGWRLGAELGISAILVRPRFEVSTGTSRETVWEPWPISPLLRISASADVL